MPTRCRGGQADCVLIGNYQYNNVARQCESHHLTPLATGKVEGYFFAVNEGSKELYSILTRTTGIVSDATINAALTSYSAQDAKSSLLDFVRENPFVVVAAIAVLVALLAVIIAQRRINNCFVLHFAKEYRGTGWKRSSQRYKKAQLRTNLKPTINKGDLPLPISVDSQ